jgi:adenosine kinase
VKQVEALIITKGAEGAVIYTADKSLQIPAVPPKIVTDPTGCGDAFRGGLLYGLMNDLDWEMTGRIASLMGTIKIEQYGTQNHAFNLAAFQQRFEDSFGMTLRLPNV